VKSVSLAEHFTKHNLRSFR